LIVRVTVSSQIYYEEYESTIISGNGNPIGSVSLPEGTEGDLVIQVIDIGLGFPVLDITLSANGNLITQFDDPVEICFDVPPEYNDIEVDEACLSFLNEETGEFECQDKCLETNESQICGKKDHFTSFSILLDGRGGSSCGSDDELDTYFWLSLGFVGGAVYCIIFAMLLLEFKIRRKSRIISRGIVVVETQVENVQL